MPDGCPRNVVLLISRVCFCRQHPHARTRQEKPHSKARAHHEKPHGQASFAYLETHLPENEKQEAMEAVKLAREELLRFVAASAPAQGFRSCFTLLFVVLLRPLLQPCVGGCLEFGCQSRSFTRRCSRWVASSGPPLCSYCAALTPTRTASCPKASTAPSKRGLLTCSVTRSAGAADLHLPIAGRLTPPPRLSPSRCPRVPIWASSPHC